MKPFTFIFWVHGQCGPDRYLMKSEATSKTDAAKRGKAYAKAEFIRFMDAIEGHDSVAPSANDALEIRAFPGLLKSKGVA